MPSPLLLLIHLLLFLRPTHPRDDRGDVPGWVLVTVMSAGLVAVLWGVAEGELRAMLRSALDSVR
jgi:hypothetical protein